MENDEEIFANKFQTLTKIDYLADLCIRCKDKILNHDFFLSEYKNLLNQLPPETQQIFKNNVIE